MADRPLNALTDRARRDDTSPYYQKPLQVSDEEFSREWTRMRVIRLFEENDARSLEAYARQRHPDAMAVSFDKINKLIRVLKPSGAWLTMAH